ncbi:hypothetical protein [Lysobacter gummosus]|uniref:hypothetical protein n=1 Tax=Lysobacter gummosus TaxID=262324 RepID=UPI0036274D2F
MPSRSWLSSRTPSMKQQSSSIYRCHSMHRPFRVVKKLIGNGCRSGMVTSTSNFPT